MSSRVRRYTFIGVMCLLLLGGSLTAQDETTPSETPTTIEATQQITATESPVEVVPTESSSEVTSTQESVPTEVVATDAPPSTPSEITTEVIPTSLATQELVPTDVPLVTEEPGAIDPSVDVLSATATINSTPTETSVTFPTPTATAEPSLQRTLPAQQPILREMFDQPLPYGWQNSEQWTWLETGMIQNKVSPAALTWLDGRYDSLIVTVHAQWQNGSLGLHGSGYRAEFDSTGHIALYRDTVLLSETQASYDSKTMHRLTLSVQNGHLAVMLDEQTILSTLDAQPLPAGSFEVSTTGTARLDEVLLAMPDLLAEDGLSAQSVTETGLGVRERSIEDIAAASAVTAPVSDLSAQFYSNETIPGTIRVAITGYLHCNDWLNAGRPVQRIENMSFKDYVKGVLPQEWISGWHANALRAGAVAAKMYAWYRINYPYSTWFNSSDNSYDVVDNTCNQVYSTPRSASTNNAVDETWQYRLRSGGTVADLQYRAYDSQCSGISNCMGQWNSADKANAGWDWQSILMYYYGGYQLDYVNTSGGAEFKTRMLFGTTYTYGLNGNTHRLEYWFDQNYPNYILDIKPSSGTPRLMMKLVRRSDGATISSATSVPGRGIFYGVDNGLSEAGWYDLYLEPMPNSSGSYNATIWSCCKPRNLVEWGQAGSYSNIRSWEYYWNGSGSHFLEFLRDESNGTVGITVRRRNDNALVANETLNFPAEFSNVEYVAIGSTNEGWYDVSLNFSGPMSYRWQIMGGSPFVTPHGNLQFKDIASTKVTLTWTDSPNESRYEVWRKSDTSSWAQVAVGLPTNTTSYTDQNIACSSRTYTYMVRAINRYTAVDTAPKTLTLPACIGTPTMTAPAADALLTTLYPVCSWAAVAGATGYQVQVATNEGFTALISYPAASLLTTTTNLTLPALPGLGSYYCRAAARDSSGNYGNFGAARHFRVSVLKTPAHDQILPMATLTTTALRPTFTWLAVPGAVGFQVIIANDELFNQTRYTSSVLASTTLSHTLPATEAGLPAGRYYWRLKILKTVTGEVMPESSPLYHRFAVSQPVPPVPMLVTPTVSANTNVQTFKWNAVVYAGLPITYELQVSKVSTFQSLDFAPAKSNATTISASGLVDGLYYWRVRAVNQYGLTSAWSPARSFTLDRTAPAAPMLTAPTADATISSTRPTLSATCTGASGYRFDLAHDADFQDPILTDQAVATPNLALTTLFLSDPLPQTTYYWRAACKDAAQNWSVKSALRAFMVNLALTPADKTAIVTAATTRPTFTWAAFGVPNTPYIVEIASDINFSNTVHTSPEIKTTSYQVPINAALPWGEYFWRVWVAYEPPSYEIYRSFSVTKALPAAPALTAPTTGLITNTLPTVRWNPVSGNIADYEVIISAVNAFTTIDQRAVTSGTEHIVEYLSDKLYYVKVRARNNDGAYGPWSAPRSFTLDMVAPGVPLLTAPADATSATTLRPVFTWGAVATATSYEIQLAPTAAFVHPLITITTTPTYTPLAELSNRLTYWRVRAKDAAGNWGNWSTVRSVTPRSDTGSVLLTCRSTVPSLTLAWEAVTWAFGYDLQVSKTSTFEPANLVYTNAALPSTATSFTTTTLPNGRYYWHVRARTEAGIYGAWSSAVACSVDAS